MIKKMMALLVAISCAIGAWADVTGHLSGTDFSGLSAGPFVTGLDDSGQSSGTTYWFAGDTADFEGTIVTNLLEEKFLDFESNITNPLYRTISGCWGATTPANFETTPIGTGLFIDTTVQFTPYLVNENHPAPSAVTAEDKLIVWVRETEVENDANITNLIVTAGYLDVNGDVTPSNYVANLSSAEVSALCAGEHRLTIKSYENITTQPGAYVMGFVVYLDEDPIEYAGNAFADNCVFFPLIATPAQYYTQGGANNKLFPSLLTYGSSGAIADYSKLSGVGYAGMGKIGDVFFDDYAHDYPAFAADDLSFQVVVGSGVSSFSYLGETYTTNCYFTVPPTTASVTISNVIYSAGYKHKTGTWHNNVAVDNQVDGENGDYGTFLFANGTELTLAGFQPNFIVNGVEYENLLGSDGALAAAMAGDYPLVLNNDIVIAITEGNGYLAVSDTLTIDLNGHTIQGTSEDYATIENLGSELTIVDTSSTKLGKVLASPYGASMQLYDGVTALDAGTYETIVPIEDAGLTLVLNGGTYLDASHQTSEDPFYLQTYVASGKTVDWNQVGELWYATVASSQTVTVTLPVATNAQWVVKANGNVVVGTENVYAVDAGADVTVEAVAAEGYVFENGVTNKTVYTFDDISENQDKSGDAAPVASQAKAKVGTVLYLTLQSAIDAATPGDRVELLDNVSVSSTIVVAADKSLTLDLCGYTLTSTAPNSGDQCAILNYGTLGVSNGTFTATATTLIRTPGGTVTIYDGTYTAAKNGISCAPASGSALPWATGSTINFRGGSLTTVEMGLLTGKSANSTITVTGGTLTSTDNACIGDNGTANCGGHTINVTGATLNGSITSSGYVACGIYIANDTALVVSNTTISVTGGCGILARAGDISVLADTVITTTGTAVGKVGDSRVVVPCSAIVYDTDAAYPGYSSTSELAVKGGTFSSGVACVTQVNEKGGDIAIAVSGGTFDHAIDGKYCADGYVPEYDETTGKYGVTPGYTIAYVSEHGTAPASTNVTVAALGDSFTLTADLLPALTETGYVFNGWDKQAGDAITADTTITASWSAAPTGTAIYLVMGSGVDSISTSFNGTDWTAYSAPLEDVELGSTLYIKGTSSVTGYDVPQFSIVVDDTHATEQTALVVNKSAIVYFPQSSIEQEWADRNGTAAKPFVIRNYADLVALKTGVANGTITNQCFEQVADIDMDGEEPWAGIGAFEIRTAGAGAFEGSYDGGNHVISNVTFDQHEYNGIFASVVGGVIKNLTVDVDGFAATSAFGGAAIAGVAKNCFLTNLVATGTIIGQSSTPCTHSAAGIAVRMEGTVAYACTNRCEIWSSKGKLGGIAAMGQGDRADSLILCSNEGDIHGTKTGGLGDGGVGGIFGWQGYGDGYLAVTYTNCRNIGQVTSLSSDKTGSILGYHSNSGPTFVGTTVTRDNMVVSGYGQDGVTYGKSIGGGLVELCTQAAFETNNTYSTMWSGLTPTFEFSAPGTISFNTNLFAATAFAITATGDLDVDSTEAGGIVTFTASVPTPADPWAPDYQTDESASNKVVSIFGEGSDVANHVNTLAEYGALVAYITNVTSEATVPSDLTGAQKSWMWKSFILGANPLFDADVAVEITDITANTEAGKWDFTVKVTEGESTDAYNVAADKVAALVKIRTSLTTGTWVAPTAGNIEAVKLVGGNLIKVTVNYGDGASGFMKVSE